MNKFYPYDYIDSVYEFDFKKLHEDGVNAVIFDIDNTLVKHGAPADKKAIDFFNNLKEIGLKTCLLSNNKPVRVEPFAQKTGSYYIADAKKPSKKIIIRRWSLCQAVLKIPCFLVIRYSQIYMAQINVVYILIL